MLRSFFASLFAIILTLGLGISSVSAQTVEVKLGTDAGMLAFEPSTINISEGCLLYTSPSPRDIR